MLPREKGTWVKPKLAKHRTAKSRLSINQFPESHETGIKKKNQQNNKPNKTKTQHTTSRGFNNSLGFSWFLFCALIFRFLFKPGKRAFCLLGFRFSIPSWLPDFEMTEGFDYNTLKITKFSNFESTTVHIPNVMYVLLVYQRKGSLFLTPVTLLEEKRNW